jgi:hypothetical protein
MIPRTKFWRLGAACLVLIATATVTPLSTQAENASAHRIRSAMFGDRITILISESRKTVYAFSDDTGRAESCSIDAADVPLEPIFGGEVVCFVIGTKLYAYGARSAKWSIVDVGVAGAIPVVRHRRIQVDVGSKCYSFAATSNEWAVIDLAK